MHTTEVMDKAAGHITKRGYGCGTGRILVSSSYFMRSLFNTGLGYLDLLAEEPGFSDTDGERYVRHVNDNMKALHSLFEELTDMGRVEAGVEKLLVEEGDAGAFFSLIRERMSPLGVSLEVDCQKAVRLYLDRKRLAKVMVNLMVSVAREGIRHFRVSVTEAENGMADLALAGTADTVPGNVAPGALAGATIEPTLNLEIFRGWVEIMGGWVHQATFRPQAFNVKFSLPASENDERDM